MSNSNSESESFFFCPRIFFGARAFVLAAADRMRDESSSSSSSSESPSLCDRCSPSGPCNGGSMAPHRSRSASSSVIFEHVTVSQELIALAFKLSFTISAPCDELIPNFPPPVYDQHGNSRIWEVCDAFVANDRHELRVRISTC